MGPRCPAFCRFADEFLAQEKGMIAHVGEKCLG
jgi:hypothetical protein